MNIKPKDRMQDTEEAPAAPILKPGTFPIDGDGPAAPILDPSTFHVDGDAPAHLPKPGEPPPDSDTEWAAMQAMMERFGRLPVKVDSSPVVTGPMNAAHAEGPLPLHEATETKPQPDPVIIRDHVLPTTVLPRHFGQQPSFLERHGTNLALAIGGCIAGLIAIFAAKTIYFPAATTGATEPADSANAASVAAARRTPDLADVLEPRNPVAPPAASSAPAPAPLASSSADRCLARTAAKQCRASQRGVDPSERPDDCASEPRRVGAARGCPARRCICHA